MKPIRTGADGRVNAAFVLPHAGLFQVKLLLDGEPLPLDKDQSEGTSGYSPFEGMGTERWAPFSAVAIDERLSPLQLTPENEAVIFPAHIESDKAFDVVCVVPEEATQAWLTISGEETTVTNPVELHGRVAHCNIDHPPGFMGVGLARLSYVFPDGSGQSCMHPFKVDHSSLDLNVTIAPVDRVQRPGAEAELEFTTKDHLGRPKRAELALAVADDAVVQLAGPKQEKVSPVFCETNRTTSAETLNFGRISSITLERIRDPRPGILLNTMGGYSDEETILLSPFMVEASDDVGYYATSTLAGTRVRTELKDVGSSISVVTRQFLQDTGTGNSADLLVYTPKTEVAGLSGHSGGAPAKPIEIRRHFSSTAHWDPEIITDKNGRARVKFKYPDNLTQWRIDAYAVGEDGNTFGGAGTLTQTSLPLQARLQLPRFLVAGDTAVASAALVNRVDHDLIADVQLKASGVIGIDPAQAAQTGLVVPKQAEARAAWTIHAPQAGKAELGLLARAGAEGDAMILPLPIMEDGIQQQTAATGRLAEEGKNCVLSLLLPETLDRERTKVTLELSPSYAATMLDALPYLVDYPYGCVEQTMNRFLPAVIVRKTLVDLGLNADEVEKRILARETAPDATRRQKTAGLGRLDEVVKLSLTRLDEAQHYKGGFGWWPGAAQTDLWMTAYVVWGLDLAKTAGLELPDNLLEKSTDALISSMIETTDQSDVRAFALATLARHPGIKKSGHYKALGEVFARAYENRDKISPSGRACLTLAVSTFGTSGQRDILLRNLENGALRVSGSDRGDTVHWGATGGYWRAMDSTVETTALTVFALLELEPKHPLIEPAVNWLLLNRRSSHWASTRDTAFTVLALNRYVQQRNELKGESEIEVLVNGATVQRVKLTRESLLEGPLALSLPAAMLRAGGNTVELRRTGGRGPVYAVVLGSAWARSDDVNPVANLIGVARSFVRNAAQPTLVGTLRIVPEPLPSGGSAMVGEEVSAHIILTVPNDLEYVMVAVPKPAGCEPLNPLSGWDARIQRTGEASAPGSSVPAEKEPARPVYREERDDKSVFFLDRLAAGTWEIKFGLRAVTVGDFRALPVQATAMYVPEVSANSEARRMKIESTDSGGKNSQR